MLTELFCETKKLTAEVTYQVKERTKQHALIIGSSGTNQTFAFDHDEFRNFFLGDTIGKACAKANPLQKMEVLGLLRKGSLPGQTIDAAISAIRSGKVPACEKVAAFLQEVASLDGLMSFTHENVARLLIKILHDVEGVPMTFSKLSFSADALRDLHLSNVTFNECSFAATSLQNTVLKNCRFESCHFEQIELDPTEVITSTALSACEVMSLIPSAKGDPIYDPGLFSRVLRAAGFQLPAEPIQESASTGKATDPNIKLLVRLLRYFQFRTYINEHVVLRKFGPGAEMFVRNVLPKLIKANVLGTEWIARDKQSRYHLAMSMERLHGALQRASGSIDEFLKDLSTRRSE
jgi:uncharacterized protein YjbI with pentapeptide repeats